MRSIKMCNKRLNPELTVQGIVMTMYDGRTKLSDQVVNEVRKFFGKKVYKTMIPRNVRLSEAPSHRKPAIAYDKESKARGRTCIWRVSSSSARKRRQKRRRKLRQRPQRRRNMGKDGKKVSAWASARSSARNIRPHSRSSRRLHPIYCQSKRSSRAPTNRASALTRRRWKCSRNPSAPTAHPADHGPAA